MDAFLRESLCSAGFRESIVLWAPDLHHASPVAELIIVKRPMRAFRIILVVAVVLGLLWLLPMMFESHYIRLQHKSRTYYVELELIRSAAVQKL